jgi:class 3 adenylate cyclase
MTARRVRIPLAAKLLAMALLVSVVPLGALGLTLIDVNRDALVQTNQDLLLAVVDDVAGDLEAEIAATRSGLQAVARTLGDDSLADDARIAVALSLVAADPHLGAVGIYGADGLLIDTLRARGTSELPKRLSEAARAEAGRGLLALGEVEAGREGARMLVAAPIGTAAATWFAAAHVSLAPLQQRAERIGEVRFGGHGEVFAVDTRLRAIVHTDAERSARLDSLAGEGILAGVDGDAIDEGLSLFGEFTGDDGVARVGALHSLTGAPWAVIAQVPRSVAYASLERTRLLVAVVLGALALVAIGIATLLAQRITAPLRALVHLARELAARRFDGRAAVRSNDEVGVLADALNGAASDLEASEARLAEEQAIRADLRRYLPAQLVDRIVERSQNVALGGERRAITVVFADVAGFTSLAENRPPERVVELLNELFTLLTELVYRHGGTVDKFMGDCIMAFLGRSRSGRRSRRPRPERRRRHAAPARNLQPALAGALRGHDSPRHRRGHRRGDRRQLRLRVAHGVHGDRRRRQHRRPPRDGRAPAADPDYGRDALARGR